MLVVSEPTPYPTRRDIPLLCSVWDTSDETGNHGHVLAVLFQSALHLLAELRDERVQLFIVEDKVWLELGAYGRERHDEINLKEG